MPLWLSLNMYIRAKMTFENIFSQKFSRKRSVLESSKVPTLIYYKVSCGENLRFSV